MRIRVGGLEGSRIVGLEDFGGFVILIRRGAFFWPRISAVLQFWLVGSR